MASLAAIPNPVDSSAKPIAPLGDPQPKIVRPAALHVADLRPEVTESILFDFFRGVGDKCIQSIRICRDSHTRQSLGYAYVNFVDEASANRAIEALNFELILGRPCRITYSRRDSSVRKSGKGNLFVKNLPRYEENSIDNAALLEIFENFGEILSSKVSIGADGKSRGYGFVHFKNLEDAESAKAAMNGKFVNGQKIDVMDFIPREQRSNPSTQFTNLYFKQMNPALTQEEFEESIRAVTAGVAEVVSPKLMTQVSPDGKEVSKGFGFCSFKTHEGAKKALEIFTKNTEKVKELAPNFLHPEQSLYVNVAASKAKRESLKQPERNLYVKSFPDDFDSKRLEELFQEFGPITSAKVMCQESTNVSRGFGFVCFENLSDAREAIKMNGREIGGKPLYVSVAQPKALRQQQLVVQHTRLPPGPPYGNPLFMRGMAMRPMGAHAHTVRPFPAMRNMQEEAHQPANDPRMKGKVDQFYQALLADGLDSLSSGKVTGVTVSCLQADYHDVNAVIAQLDILCENREKRKEKVHEVFARGGNPPTAR